MGVAVGTGVAAGVGMAGGDLDELGIGGGDERGVDPAVLAAEDNLPPAAGRVFAGDGVLVAGRGLADDVVVGAGAGAHVHGPVDRDGGGRWRWRWEWVWLSL